jgi:hypothetical protein
VGEEAVEVCASGLGEVAGADGDLGDGVAGDGGLGDGPDEGVILVCRGELLGDCGEAGGHAEREAEIDGEREARASAEDGAADGVEKGGVDEALAGAEVVVGDGEVGPAGDGGGQGADRVG